MVDKNDPNSESSSSDTPKIVAVVILVVLVIIFFIFKSTESGDKQGYARTASPPEAELDILDSEEVEIAADSLDKSDSLITAQTVAAKDPNAKDTIRFECKRLETEKFCGGVKQQGADEGMRYFNNTTSRYLTHKDTTQIVISVPWRTKLFVNNSPIEYVKDNHNTFLFYEGRIVNSYYKKL
jgi:hypothetical protein